MKNNTITSSQFYIATFISILSSLLFIDNTTSNFQIFLLLLSILLCMIFTLFYNGKFNKFTEIITHIYFILMPAIVLAYFVNFMNSAVDSGPYWAILLLIAITIYFCSIKGIESLCRGGTILLFFIVLSLLFIFVGSFSNISVKELKNNGFLKLTPALIMFYPLATYISNKSLIKDSSKYPLVVYSLGALLVVGYLIFYSNSTQDRFPLFILCSKLQISVFKGGDCLLMSIITIAVIYFVSFALNSISTIHNKKTISKTSFVLIIFITAVLLYSGLIKSVIFSQTTMIILTVLIVLSAIFNNISNISKHNA